MVLKNSWKHYNKLSKNEIDVLKAKGRDNNFITKIKKEMIKTNMKFNHADKMEIVKDAIEKTKKENEKQKFLEGLCVVT